MGMGSNIYQRRLSINYGSLDETSLLGIGRTSCIYIIAISTQTSTASPEIVSESDLRGRSHLYRVAPSSPRWPKLDDDLGKNKSGTNAANPFAATLSHVGQTILGCRETDFLD